MRRKVVHHHDVARLQLRHEALFDVGFERRTVHRAAEQHGVTLPELVERLGVTRTTVWRYLRALTNAGSPVFEEQDGRTKRLRLHASARHEAVQLSQAQILSLFLTRRAMGFLRGIGFDDDLDDVLG